MSDRFELESHDYYGSGHWFIGIAGATVQDREAVYMDGNGRYQPADADLAATMPCMGITIGGAPTGGRVAILTRGFINIPGSAWTAGAELYVFTAPGALIYTAPTAPDVVQQVGIAFTTTQIWFDPQGVAGAATALIYARERPLASQGPRDTLNFIEGANVTLTVADNPVNAEIDITIAAVGGEADQDIFYEAPNPDDYKGYYASMLLTDGVSTTIRQTFYLPANYLDTWSVDVIVIPDADGNLRWGVDTNFGAVCTEEYDENTDTIALGQTAVQEDDIECLDITDALTGAAAGDLVGLTFVRGGGDALDTVDDEVHYIGVILRVPEQ